MNQQHINERVAKALGWKWRNYDPNSFELIERIPCYTAPNGDIYANPPNYSGSIEAAWEIVEHVRSKHPYWRFCLLGGDKKFRGYKAEWFGHEDPKKDYGQRHADEYARTAPMAICLAFLKLIESRSEAVIRRVDEEGERDK